MQPIIEQPESSGPKSGIVVRDPQASLIVQLRMELAELRRERAELKRHSMRDPLSGHYSAAYLEDRVVQEWARMRQNWTQLSVLRIRVDGPREAAVLAWAGWWVGQIARSTDVVAHGRDDDFVVLMPETSRAQAEALRSAIVHRTRRDPKAPTSTTLRVELAIALEDADTPQALIEAAPDRELDTIPAPPPAPSQPECLLPPSSWAPPPLPSDLPR